MKVYNLTCINCPIGCHLEVEEIIDRNEKAYVVRGNSCNRGEKYGVQEVTNPVRMLTSTVKIEGARLRRIPVKTSEPIPKPMLLEAMRQLDQITIQAPVNCGDKVLENLLDLNIDVIASRSIDRDVFC